MHSQPLRAPACLTAVRRQNPWTEMARGVQEFQREQEEFFSCDLHHGKM